MEKEKEQLTVKGTLVEFCEYTTVHGLHFLVIVRNRWIHLLWTLVVLLGFVGLSFHLYSIVHAYLEYKTTEYSYEIDYGYEFPDVTVCNLNGISASNLKAAASKYPEVRYFIDKSNITSKRPNEPPSHSSDLFWALGTNAAEVGHSFKDFVLECNFEDHPCNSSAHFVLYPFSSYFNCYTFTRGRYQPLTTTQGIAAALSLTLFLEPLDLDILKPYDNSAFTGTTDGVRVLLTPPNSLAPAGVMGYDILPGKATYIAFDITKRTRLPDPYSNCRAVDSMPLGDGLTYSFTECKNICIHKLIVDKCGCFPSTYKVRRNYTALKKPSCAQTVLTDSPGSEDLMISCQNSELQNIETKINFANDCNCYPPCEDTKYSITMSHSEFPSINSFESFWDVVLLKNREEIKALKYYQKLLAENASWETLASWTQRHFLRLNVYANSKTVSVKEQIPMITEIDLMSQIGGCLGLWVGMSIITVIEFFDLGFKLFYGVCRRTIYSAGMKTNAMRVTVPQNVMNHR